MNNNNLRKQYNGCYRVTLSAEYFGQIKRSGREWTAEVRHTTTGQLARYAGVWRSKKDAAEELLTIRL